MGNTKMTVEQQAEAFRERFAALREQVGRVIVGQHVVVEGVLTAIFAGGHCLLEGVPGLGKTLLVHTLAHSLHLSFSRIQFTPDLMPADIIGSELLMETPEGKRYFEFRPGPLFAQIILADEINRATPKTQSALLEAMQEHRVTVTGKTYPLEEPFFVMATQNPIEQEGTYPLPEAQLDRFAYKHLIQVPERDELHEILNRTTKAATQEVTAVMDAAEVCRWQRLVREVLAAEPVQDYAVRLVLATHPHSPFAVEEVKRYVRYGASPRGAQYLILGAKVRALLNGRFNVSFQDIRQMAPPALRHRLILNFEGEAEGKTADDVLGRILEQVPIEA